MRLVLVAFTERGAKLAARLAEELPQYGYDCEAFAAKKIADSAGISVMEDSLSAWTCRAFSSATAIVFVGACGIAVRSIAPWLKDKWEDPAVVVIDELGRFSISLVSGHVGGANGLACQTASIIGAQPVITTATDINGLFSVDVWAKQNGFYIESREAAKEVSASLLKGETVKLQSDFSIIGTLPKNITLKESGELGISISLFEKKPFAQTCLLRPISLVLGIGCKKGTPAVQIFGAVQEVLTQAKLSFDTVCGVCSIDLKAEEPGLIGFCRENKFPFSCFSAQELKAVPGSFTASSFVCDVTGVDNVCERAAVLGAGNGTLILKKQIISSVTVACAMKHVMVDFENMGETE